MIFMVNGLGQNVISYLANGEMPLSATEKAKQMEEAWNEHRLTANTLASTSPAKIISKPNRVIHYASNAWRKSEIARKDSDMIWGFEEMANNTERDSKFAGTEFGVRKKNSTPRPVIYLEPTEIRSSPRDSKTKRWTPLTSPVDTPTSPIQHIGSERELIRALTGIETGEISERKIPQFWLTNNLVKRLGLPTTDLKKMRLNNFLSEYGPGIKIVQEDNTTTGYVQFPQQAMNGQHTSTTRTMHSNTKGGFPSIKTEFGYQQL